MVVLSWPRIAGISWAGVVYLLVFKVSPEPWEMWDEHFCGLWCGSSPGGFLFWHFNQQKSSLSNKPSAVCSRQQCLLWRMFTMFLYAPNRDHFPPRQIHF